MPHRALTIQQVADKEHGQRAETEKGDAQRQFVAYGVEEDQRIHERRQTARKHQHNNRCQDGELQLAAFEMIQFLAVQRSHNVLAGDPEAVGAGLSMLLGAGGKEEKMTFASR